MPITGIIQSLGGFGDDEDLYGTKPVVPEAPRYGRAINQAVQSNIGNLPRIEELAEQSTALYGRLLELAAPGATATIAKQGSIISDLLAGKLPTDVQNMMAQYRREQSRAGGTAGSLFQLAGEMTDIGKTSLEAQMSGMTAAERWLAAGQTRTFDFSKLLMDKNDAFMQADARFNRDWLAAQVAAAPDPEARGAFDSEMAMLGMVLSAYGGGAGYTGAYRSPYQGGGGPPPRGGYSDGNSSFFGAPQFRYGGEGNALYEETPGPYAESRELIV